LRAADLRRRSKKEKAVSNPPRLWRTFLIFLAPMMLTNILQSLLGTINGIYLGQMIGVDALAAVSAFFPIMFFFISFVIGLGAGASVLIGQAWGAGEPEKVRAVAGTTLTVALLGSALIAVFGGLFCRQLLIALATPPGILDTAESYARIMLVTMPLTFVFILLTSMLRGTGDTLTPLMALAISAGLGLLATPALIKGWLGLPQLGVASAAWASAISGVFALLWLTLDLRRRRHVLAVDAAFLRAMSIDGALLRKVLNLGIPSAAGIVTMSVAELVLLGLVNGFGAGATAAYGAVNQVLGYAQFPAVSIAITVSIFGAQAIGRGHSNQIGSIVRTGLLMNLVLTGGLVTLAYLLSRIIMGFFIVDPTVLELAQRLLHIVLWSSVLFGMALVFSGAMRSSGTVWAPLSIQIFAIAGIEVPSAILLGRIIGIDGIWTAYPIAFSSMFLLQMSYYLFVWRKRAIKRLI
jgi:putative MATE family efflux protein